MTKRATHCGTVAIIGRPNVGKSTLFNAILAEKISATSAKPQTTRLAIRGIKTVANTQFVYVDTPGLHQDRKSLLQKAMMHEVTAALHEVDVVVMVIDAKSWQRADDWVMQCIIDARVPVILAINKVDKLSDKAVLLPLLVKYHEMHSWLALVPLSARRKDNLVALENEIAKALPKKPFLFAEGISNRGDEQFYLSELIREQLLRALEQEVPYQTSVVVESFEQTARLITINASIIVARSGQKKIIIGERGQQLKEIGQPVRLFLEKLYGKKVMLKLFVKVREDWFNDPRALKDLGFKSN